MRLDEAGGHRVLRRHTERVLIENQEPAGQPVLTVKQAYEAMYRFVARYYDRERIAPLFLMLVSMGESGVGADQELDDRHLTNDPAAWADWEECVVATVNGNAWPEPSPPDE